jgi:hypothetical protein
MRRGGNFVFAAGEKFANGKRIAKRWPSENGKQCALID